MLVDWAAIANVLLRMFWELTIHLTLNAQAEKNKSRRTKSPGNKKGLYCKAEHPRTSQTEAYSEAVNPSHPHTSIKTS